MLFLNEIKDIKNSLLTWFIIFILGIICVGALGLQKQDIKGYTVYMPSVTAHSVASSFFIDAKTKLVPEGVSLLATNPITVFIAQIKIAVLISFVLTFPVFLYGLFRYLSPALYKKESRSMVLLLIPSTLLFIGGAYFAYAYIIPPMFKALYTFTLDAGVAPFFDVEEFISWVLVSMFMVGAMFLLPIFMYLVSFLGVLPRRFWLDHWRGALMTFLVLSAIITPDVSGISVLFLSIPMIALYVVGLLLVLLTKKGIVR